MSCLPQSYVVLRFVMAMSHPPKITPELPTHTFVLLVCGHKHQLSANLVVDTYLMSFWLVARILT